MCHHPSNAEPKTCSDLGTSLLEPPVAISEDVREVVGRFETANLCRGSPCSIELALGPSRMVMASVSQTLFVCAVCGAR